MLFLTIKFMHDFVHVAEDDYTCLLGCRILIAITVVLGNIIITTIIKLYKFFLHYIITLAVIKRRACQGVTMNNCCNH